VTTTFPNAPRILLVEDSDRDAFLVQTVLRNSAVVVERVSSLNAALVALRSSSFDLILTDLGLPDSTGTGTVEALLDAAGVTPVIAITGHADESAVQDLVEAGAQDYLVKGSAHAAPQLLRAVQYALQRARERHDDNRSEVLGANAKFRALIDCAEVTVVLDAHRRCVYASPSVKYMLGFDPAELIGRVLERAGTLRRKDGRTLAVQSHASPLFDDEGALTGTVLTFRDVATQRHLEQQIEQTLRLALLGQAAASTVHELSNLMTVVFQHAGLLLRRVGHDDTLAKPVTLISDAVRRAKRLSDEILRFTRPPEPSFETIDVGRWLERVAEEARALLDGRTLLLELPKFLRVSADADQLSQVILNLAANARDATPPDATVILGAARADTIPFVRERIEDAASFTAIFVRDHGTGIAAEIRERLFEPLFTTKPDGHGFGLSTSFRIVARHRGRILIDSEPGAGSTFYIVLPQ
jgi:signal transduction histidine kinase